MRNDSNRADEKLYVKISLEGGGTYVQPIEAIADALDSEFDGANVGDKWTLEIVKMTKEEHDRLPEFEGH